MFLLSNRDPAALQFWPFGFVLALPLGAVVLALFVLGFLFGLVFHLPSRLALGRRARRAERRVADLETRLSTPLPPNEMALPPPMV